MRGSLACLVISVALVGCAGDAMDVETDPGDSADELSEFNPGRVVSDAAFFDVAGVSQASIQSMLESNPHDGGRSFLADERSRTGELFSASLVRIARASGLNPLVLLATLQKEAGLVSKTVRPGGELVD